MHKRPVNDIAKKHFYDVHHQLPLARIQAFDFCFCLPSSALLESTYKSSFFSVCVCVCVRGEISEIIFN